MAGAAHGISWRCWEPSRTSFFTMLGNSHLISVVGWALRNPRLFILFLLCRSVTRDTNPAPSPVSGKGGGGCFDCRTTARAESKRTPFTPQLQLDTVTFKSERGSISVQSEMHSATGCMWSKTTLAFHYGISAFHALPIVARSTLTLLPVLAVV